MGGAVFKSIRYKPSAPRDDDDGPIDTSGPPKARPNVQIASAEAFHPDWDDTDMLVFERPVDNAWQYNEDERRAGRFFSRRNKAVGDWRLEANVLTLLWTGSQRPDIVKAAASEKRWRNDEGMILTIIEPDVLPDWLAPAVGQGNLALADQHFECPTCFFDLYKFPAGVMRKGRRRVCDHYIHVQCAEYLKKNKETRCPACGVPFNTIKKMPDLIKDGREWFTVVDADCSGNLTQEEIEAGMGAVLPMDRVKLRKAIDMNWADWDPDGDGTIDLNEFLRDGKGLREFILRNLSALSKDNMVARPQDVPQLDSHPLEWFEFWDQDGSGTLEKMEIIRAMIKSFCVNTNGEPLVKPAHDMRKIAALIWHDMGYHEFDSLSFTEFHRPHGFADTIVHNWVNGQFFGEDEEAKME
mmetsp:Transcript_133806/g.303501  ORF Transcript_133806/g.303501 Transcript_133806/m.303501 type:complete len:411 (+) Transcript_133806:39-1271(+)